MAKFKKQEVKVNVAKPNKKGKAEKKIGEGVKNVVNKMKPKNSGKLQKNIKQQIKKESKEKPNKKELINNDSLKEIATVKKLKQKKQNAPKLPGVGLQNGQPKDKNKGIKNGNHQINAENKVSVNGTQNKAVKAVAEKNSKKKPGAVLTEKTSKLDKRVPKNKVANDQPLNQGKNLGNSNQVKPKAKPGKVDLPNQTVEDTSNQDKKGKGNKGVNLTKANNALLKGANQSKVPSLVNSSTNNSNKLKPASKAAPVDAQVHVKKGKNVLPKKISSSSPQDGEEQSSKATVLSQKKLKGSKLQPVEKPKLSLADKSKKSFKAKENKKASKELKAKVKKTPMVLSAALQNDDIKKKKTKGVQKQKESQNPIPVLIQFDEGKFNEIIKQENIAKIVKTLKSHMAKELKKKKNKIFSDYKFMLNVTCFKIPNCPARMTKLNLKHSLISDEDDVCIIVKDLKRGLRVDYEPTVQHYEDLFREQGIQGIKAILPFNQIKKEYGSFEMKNKLSNIYDYFLCDGSIVGHVSGFLGKTFQKSRCTLHSVRMNTKNLPNEIQKSLHRTSYRQGQKGPMISVPVGHHKMSAEEVAENISEVISQFKQVYPGGLPNIRHMHIRAGVTSTPALPLYVSMANPPENIPYVVGPREIKLNKLTEEANRIFEKFAITTAGSVVQKKRVQNVSEEDKSEEPKKKKKKKDTLKDAVSLQAVADNSEENSEDEINEEDESVEEIEGMEGSEEAESDEELEGVEGTDEEESDDELFDLEAIEEDDSDEDESDGEESDEEGSNENTNDEEGSDLEFESEEDDI